MIYFSIATLFILMFCIAGPFIPGWHWRQIWLGVLMATSIHFFLWFFVHGWSMVVLGIVCMVIVTMGYIFPGIPVSVICIADAMVKLICGIYLLFIAKPSKYIPNMIKQRMYKETTSSFPGRITASRANRLVRNYSLLALFM